MKDNREFFGAVQRMVRAAYRRAAETDPEEFAALAGLPTLCADLEAQAVHALRAQGYTWEHIGRAFKMTKQAAFNRWGRKTGA